MEIEQLLINNAVVIPDPLKNEFHPNTSVVICDGKIDKIGRTSELKELYPDAVQIDAKGAILLPGLIDAHTHLYAALTGGMPVEGCPPQNFPEVLARVWWRFDKALGMDDIYLSGLVGGMASIRSGITTIFDHHASPNSIQDSLSCVASATQKCGLRACLAYEVTDRDGAERFNQGVEENIRFIKQTQSENSGLTKALFGLHAVFSLSDESLQRCAGEAADLDAGFHLHMAEHQTEVQQFLKDHTQSIPAFLKEVGILGPKTITAHTVHIDESDIALLRDVGTFNVHNPQSNMGNGVGIAPVARMIELKQPVGLGSDGFYDLPNQIILAKLLQIMKSGNPSGFSEKLALKMVYDHNVKFAEKIFGCKLGKIAPSYQADLILLSYNPATPIQESNLTTHIIGALTSGCLKKVFIDGKEVFDGEHVVGLDEEEILMKSKVTAKEVWSRL